MHDIRPYLPELFDDPGTLLYIGCRPDAHSWLDELIEAGNKVTILEIWPENVAGLAQMVLRKELKARVVPGDVRQADEIFAGSKFDYIFYWHGPEHLNLSEVQYILEWLEKKTNRTLALACPWGIYPQGSPNGNPHEEHKCTLYPHLFEIIGYEVATDGHRDEPGSEIVAWKRIDNG